MKKRMFGLLLALCLALPLGFGFAGCRGSGDDLSDVDPNRTSIKVWVQSTNQAEYFRWVKETFEDKYPAYGLSITPKKTGDLESLDVKLAGKDAPDVAATWGGQIVTKLISGKRVEKLDDVVDAEMQAVLNDGALDNKLDGKGSFYSVPLHGFASPVIFYNKTFFDEHDLTPPATYAELKAISDKIRTIKNGTSTVMPLVGGFSTSDLPHFMQALHSRTMRPEDYAKTIGFESDDPFTNDGFDAGWSYLKKLNDDKILADNINGYTISSAKTEFALQKAVMLTAVSLDIADLNRSTTFEIGSFLMPPAPSDILALAGLTEEDMADAPLVSGVYADVLVLNANTTDAKKTIAKEFFKFLLSEEAQEKLLEYDLMSVRSDISLDGINPQLKCIKDNIGRGVSGFYQSFSINGIDIKIKDAGVGVLLGEKSASEATKEIADFYKQHVDSYR